PPLAPRLLGPAGPDALDALVAGPLCTPLDTWSRGAKLPELSPGDLVAVPNVGAYGLSASLVAFLGHPLPVEVVVDGDRPGSPARTSRVELVRTTDPNHEE
ncbi:type III PLP-dependent enzyme, partial [Amycolatopsis sp. SID8362]|nr:type III PLP-dependent enzyme [Amycolatopsis sp. SID8362]NED43949.1 type III PLP-dependent enzyme [Amycolatopsis sp. SID8362]